MVCDIKLLLAAVPYLPIASIVCPIDRAKNFGPGTTVGKKFKNYDLSSVVLSFLNIGSFWRDLCKLLRLFNDE